MTPRDARIVRDTHETLRLVCIAIGNLQEAFRLMLAEEETWEKFLGDHPELEGGGNG